MKHSIRIYKAVFEEARKSFPGKKRGFKVEWSNFLKKYKSKNARVDFIMNVTQAIRNYERYLEFEKTVNNFNLRPCSFSVYVNQGRYSEEYTEMEKHYEQQNKPVSSAANWREQELNG